MKVKIQKIIDFLINRLERFRVKLSDKKTENSGYSSLSPVANADNDNHYYNTLLWALENRREEDIKNIALTGPNGSGKSSVLKTFQKKYRGSDLKFLNISLATFKEEKQSPEGDIPKPAKTELLRLIEISILEQIFYKEKDSKVPDSRFKKIKSYSIKKLLLSSFLCLLFLSAILSYVFPELIKSELEKYNTALKVRVWLHYIRLVILLSGLFFIIFKSIRVINALRINKLQFQNAEIGIGDTIDKSILNHHIDELLYFFEVRPYNVVVIEDLDRFYETEIFTKLRELNLLLNTSEKTKEKSIVFIYAVRDDMFVDKFERTKFFDFIIPVIPVINSSNSSEILLRKNKELGYALTEDFIENVAFFIDDMRTLHNILNEFSFYKQKLDDKLIQNKLFAIITYKNIYPADFVELNNNKGELYAAIKQKQGYYKFKIDELDEKIKKAELEIKNLNSLAITSVKELRSRYVLNVIGKLSSFITFTKDDSHIPIEKMLEDGMFLLLRQDEAKYKYSNSYGGERAVSAGTFKTVENIVDPLKTYLIREREVKDIESGSVERLRKDILSFEEQKGVIRNKKLMELVTIDLNLDLNIQKDLNKYIVSSFLRNGYIAEDYLDYISLFHESSITRSDYRFLISINNQALLQFDYALGKIDKLIAKMNPLVFNSEFALNYDLLNYILNNQHQYKNQLDQILTKLKDESKISIDFINSFLEKTQKLPEFVQLLCSKWSSIWNHFDENISYSPEKKHTILKYIINYAELADIKTISDQSALKQMIQKDTQFLSIIANEDKLQGIIELLSIQFLDIDFEKSSVKLLQFVYDNWYYQLSKEMIELMIKRFGNFDLTSFNNSNYKAVKNSQAGALIEYVDGWINDYITDVYLSIDDNVDESESSLIDLLNNDDLLYENKLLVISKVNTIISELKSIHDVKLFPAILEENKIKPTWKNMLDAFNSKKSDEIPESIVHFINNIPNAQELAKTKVPLKVDEEEIYGEFWKKLIQVNDISDSSYNLITKASPWRYEDLNLTSLSYAKASSLVANNLINPTVNGFQSLKDKSKKLSIKLLEGHTDKLIEVFDELKIDIEDLHLVIQSKILNNSIQLKFLKKIDSSIIISNLETLKAISDLLSEDNLFNVPEDMRNTILLSKAISAENRIKIFTTKSEQFDNEFASNFLQGLGGEYAQISDPTIRATIAKNLINQNLLTFLVKKNYISSFTVTDKGEFRVYHKRN